jgi:hypothetical protein
VEARLARIEDRLTRVLDILAGAIHSEDVVDPHLGRNP